VVVFLLGQFTSQSHASLAEFRESVFVCPLQQLPGLLDPATDAGSGVARCLVTKQATLLAFLADFKVMLAVALGALPLVLFMRRPRRHTTRDQEIEAAFE